MKKIKYLIIMFVVISFVFLCKTIINKFTSYNIIENISDFLSNIWFEDVEVKEATLSDNNINLFVTSNWTSSNEVEINYKVVDFLTEYDRNKDVILLIDGSLYVSNLEFKSLFNAFYTQLFTNTNNRLMTIGFDDDAKIIHEFTNDVNVIEDSHFKFDNVDETNYNKALYKLDEVLGSYEKKDDRGLVVMFITDGDATREIKSHKSTYEIIKSKYPELFIDGIFYGSANDKIIDLKDVSDKQYVVSHLDFLNSLSEITNDGRTFNSVDINTLISNNFELIDYRISNGSVKIEDNQAIWSIKNSHLVGGYDEFVLKLKLKDEYQNIINHYSLNEYIRLNYEYDGKFGELVLNDPLVLSNGFPIHYNMNLPKGCSIPQVEDKEYLIYSKVNLEEDLYCEGYGFLGYEIEEGFEMINDRTFIMPTHSVVINAKWSKQSLAQSIDGVVREKTTLYDRIEELSQTTSKVKQYTGKHKDSYILPATKNIYHFYAEDYTTATEILDSNNVIFANHCWQMIRTTDTGGVKLIYNGEPDSNGSCGTNRSTHVGYDGASNQTLSSSYYYATDYTYDSSTNTFSLNGTKTLATWSDSTYSDLVGKYTCLSVEENGTCTTLYLVESYVSSTQAKAIKIVSTSHYSQFGTVQFNSNYKSPAYVGYMYGDVYTSSEITETDAIKYHYGESVTYDGEKYTLVNPKTFTTTPNDTDISNNHYICLTQNSDTCDKVGYIYYYSSSSYYMRSMYYITLNVGETEVNTALNNMFTKNTTSSTIKNAIDAWYEKYLLEYDEYIEQDAIYCNDRSIKALNGWKPNGGLTNNFLKFKNQIVTQDLSCTNNTDKFSVSNTTAKLKYPIGLSTAPEMNLLNNNNVRNTGNSYWLGSPHYFNRDNAFVNVVDVNGNIAASYVDSSGGVRPVVSLISGTEYVSGDGSVDSPYVIE